MSTVTSEEQDAKLPETEKPARRRLPRWLLITLVVLAVVVVAGASYLVFLPRVQPLSLPDLPENLTAADLGLENWQSYQEPLPENPLEDAQLPETPTVDPALATLQHAAGLALIEQQQLEKGLAYLKVAVQAEPDNLRFANAYRLALRSNERYNDEEKFFDELYKQHNTIHVGVSLALSYVDQMRSCPKPPDGLVCQAQYSSRSINLLDALLTEHPHNVIARYARGLNHLYWPVLMGHLPNSQKDLEYTVALTPFMADISKTFTDDAYAALGDVFAKDQQPDAAQNVWRNGLQVVPDSSLLQSRLEISKEKLADEMSGPIRGLGVYVETDIALFWT